MKHAVVIAMLKMFTQFYYVLKIGFKVSFLVHTCDAEVLQIIAIIIIKQTIAVI